MDPHATPDQVRVDHVLEHHHGNEMVAMKEIAEDQGEQHPTSKVARQETIYECPRCGDRYTLRTTIRMI